MIQKSDVLKIITKKQEKTVFLNHFIYNELLKTNIIEKYSSYDFSNIWTQSENNIVFGIIGKNNQRLRIKLLSVNKSGSNPNKYLVKGKSKVKKNICDFKGYIKVYKIQECKELYYGIDDMYINEEIKKEGVLIADYELYEDKRQKFTGIFKGTLYSKWYLDKYDKIHYDDLADGSDGYLNNAFIGLWEMYNSKLIKKCNWADWRVPDATSDFDIGAGEFSPSEKYYDKGWDSYARANVEQNIEAKKEEQIKWWK